MIVATPRSLSPELRGRSFRRRNCRFAQSVVIRSDAAGHGRWPIATHPPTLLDPMLFRTTVQPIGTLVALRVTTLCFRGQAIAIRPSPVDLGRGVVGGVVGGGGRPLRQDSLSEFLRARRFSAILNHGGPPGPLPHTHPAGRKNVSHHIVSGEVYRATR